MKKTTPFPSPQILSLWLLILCSAVFGSMAKDNLILVLNKSDNTVSFVDAKTLKIVGITSTGRGPHEVVVAPDGRHAYVSNYGTAREPGQTVSIIDISKRQEIGKIDLGEFHRPHGLAISRDGKRLYVTCEANKALVVVDGRKRTVLYSIDTDQNGSHMVVLGPDERRAYVPNTGSSSVTVIDLPARKVVTHVKLEPGAEGIDLSPDGRRLFVASRQADSLCMIDTETNTISHKIKTGKSPIRVKVTPDGKYLLVSNSTAGELQILDAKSLELVATIDVGKAPVGILIEPSGKRAFVASTQGNKISVIDLVTRKVVGEFTAGQEPDGLGFAK